MFPPPTHNSVMVVYRPSEDWGVNKVLVADYLPLSADPEEDPNSRPPGGGSNVGESPEDTGRRELREETGLKAKTKATVTRVYDRLFSHGHRKYGLLIARIDCKGSILYKNPPKDKKIKFVGYRWLTFAEALKEIKPVPGINRSHHDILVAARDELIRRGLERPVVPFNI